NESFRFHVPVEGENVEVYEPGKTVLPKQVTETVKRFKKDISLKLDGFTLLLQSVRSKFNLNTFDPEEFPKLPDFAIE
ncbi:hypothetical protein OSJ97_25890, partial [Escherichia coli]|nr:hypothetical protein [Escherichia coli]